MNKGKVYAGKSDDFRLDWGTPDSIYQPLNDIFKFTVDLMADAKSTKCDHYIDDILHFVPELSLRGANEVCWINPRYGKWLYEVMPIVHEAAKWSTIVALLPASLDLSWFHDYVVHHDNVRVFCRRGRIQFEPTAAIRKYYRRVETVTGKTWTNSPAHANILVVYGMVTGTILTKLTKIGWRQI